MKTLKVTSARGNYIVRFYESVAGMWQYTVNLGVVSRLFKSYADAMEDVVGRLLK